MNASLLAVTGESEVFTPYWPNLLGKILPFVFVGVIAYFFYRRRSKVERTRRSQQARREHFAADRTAEVASPRQPVAKYTVSLEDYLAAQGLATGRKRWLNMAWALLTVIVIGLITNIRADGSIDWDPFRLVLILMVGAFLYGATIGARKRISKNYRENRAMRLEYSLSFDAAGIQWTSASGTNSLPWRDVFQYKENQDFILVYTSSLTFHILPKSAFFNSTDLQKFVQFLRGEPVSGS